MEKAISIHNTNKKKFATKIVKLGKKIIKSEIQTEKSVYRTREEEQESLKKSKSVYCHMTKDEQ